MRIRGFAGLPDGSAWVVDEVVWGPGDEERGGAGGGDDGVAGNERGVAGDDDGVAGGERWVAGGHDPEAVGRELARRMLAAGAGDLLRDAEAMAAR